MQPTYFPLVTLAAVAALTGCAKIAEWGPPSGHPISPMDVVAVRKLENLESEPGEYHPDDLIGHGWFSANFHVSHVEVGELPRKVVPVRYFGHTFFREDIRFRFRLRLNKEGGYIVCKKPDASGYNCD